jgi:tRNA A37 N6-isopentenylltransferase MiaA
MKSFIDKIFRAKKQKEILDEIIHTKVVQENKEILSKQIETSIKEKVTQDVVEEIIAEVKKKEVVIYPQPNHFSGCNCFKCVRWKNQN